MLTDIKSDIRELKRRVISNQADVGNQIDFPVNFPLKEIREVDVVELWIDGSDSNKQSLVRICFNLWNIELTMRTLFLKFISQINYFAEFGGKTAEKITRRILKELFSSAVARCFNYKGGGQSNKRAFRELILHSVVIGTVTIQFSFVWIIKQIVIIYLFSCYKAQEDRKGSRTFNIGDNNPKLVP